MKVLTIATLLAETLLAFGGEISDYHYERTKDKVIDFSKSRSFDEVGLTNHGITEIGIERTSCFGTCPSYTFIIKSDGTFRFEGDKYVERKGKFTGTISLYDFHNLAQFIKDSGYMTMDENYALLVTDNPTTYTTVVMNGKRKSISNYANAGPTKLWAIEQLVDALMTKATWDAPKKKPEQK
jgi:hypothetical protein